MKTQPFAVTWIGLLLWIQSVVGQSPVAAPTSTSVGISVPNVAAVQAEKINPAVTTNASPVIPPALEQLTVELDGGVTMEFVLIPAGEFRMGSIQNNPPVHTVLLTKPFYIGKYEVTQEQWLAVMRENRSHFNDPKRPVENVSWEDCQKFLMTLNAKTNEQRFSLPTEAQWEYACRAGRADDDNFGNEDAVLDQSGWCLKNAAHMTHLVGGLQANDWGLYDMHGNVWEWCADWFGAYDGGDEIDPTGPTTGWMRVLRGGSWCNYATSCRCANRGFYQPTTRNRYCGFRVVVDLD